MFARIHAVIFAFATVTLACWGDCPKTAGKTLAPFSQPSVVTVRELHLVNISRASVDEQQVIARALVGVCFETGNTGELSENIRDEFQQLGFFNAKVSSIDVDALDRSAIPPTVSITVSVVEGDRYRLKGITITGNKAITNTVALRKILPMKDGEWFNIELARKGVKKLKDLYGEFGFINFTPVPDFTFDQQKKLITMKIDIDEGAEYHIASFHVRGADPVREAHLLSAWTELLPIQSIYNARAVKLFFERAKDILPPGATPDRNLVIRQDNEKAAVDIVLDLAVAAAN
jgi:outer membrane protein insertion porin family